MIDGAFQGGAAVHRDHRPRPRRRRERNPDGRARPRAGPEALAEAGHPRGQDGDRRAQLGGVRQRGPGGGREPGQVGIQAEVAPFDSGVQKAMASDKTGGWKKMQMHVSRFSMRPDPSWATVWFTSAQIGEWNWERWSSKEYDQLHEQALAEANPHAVRRCRPDAGPDGGVGGYLFLTTGSTPSSTGTRCSRR